MYREGSPQPGSQGGSEVREAAGLRHKLRCGCNTPSKICSNVNWERCKKNFVKGQTMQFSRLGQCWQLPAWSQEVERRTRYVLLQMYEYSGSPPWPLFLNGHKPSAKMAFSCLFFPANHKVRKQTEKEQLVRVCKKLWFQKPMLVALATSSPGFLIHSLHLTDHSSHATTRIYLRTAELETSVEEESMHLLFILFVSPNSSAPSDRHSQGHVAFILDPYNSSLPGYWCLQCYLKCTIVFMRN